MSEEWDRRVMDQQFREQVIKELGEIKGAIQSTDTKVDNLDKKFEDAKESQKAIKRTVLGDEVTIGLVEEVRNLKGKWAVMIVGTSAVVMLILSLVKDLAVKWFSHGGH